MKAFLFVRNERTSKRLSRAMFLLGVGGAAAAVAQVPSFATPELGAAVRALLDAGVGTDRGRGPVTPGPDTPYLQAFGRPSTESASSSLTLGPVEVTP